jgi:hypothetical protein
VSAIESAPSVRDVQRARSLIRKLIADAGGGIPASTLRKRLREAQLDDLVQTYAFGVMLSRREISVEEDRISLATDEGHKAAEGH